LARKCNNQMDVFGGAHERQDANPFTQTLLRLTTIQLSSL